MSKPNQKSRAAGFDPLTEVVRGLTARQRFLFLRKFALAWRRWMRKHRSVMLGILDRGSAFSTAARTHQRVLKGKRRKRVEVPGIPNTESCTLEMWCLANGVPLQSYINRLRYGWDRIDAMYRDPEAMTHMEDFNGGPSNGKV